MKIKVVFVMLLALFLIGCDGTEDTAGQVLIQYESEGDLDIEEEYVDVNSYIAGPQVSREGYILDGWYIDDTYHELFDFSQPVTNDITLYAKWEPIKYMVTYHFDEETSIDVLVEYGGSLYEGFNQITEDMGINVFYKDVDRLREYDEFYEVYSDLDVYLEIDETKILNLFDVQALNIKQYYNNIILTEDGKLYLYDMDVFYHFNLEVQNNDVLWIELNGLFDMAVNEEVEEILYNQRDHMVFTTNTDRVILAETYMTKHMFSREKLDYIELNDYLAIGENDEITSAIASAEQTLVSTRLGHVYFWGEFQIKDQWIHISEPIDLTDDFNLNHGEVFISNPYAMYYDADVVFETNQGRYFILNDYLEMMELDVNVTSEMVTPLRDVFEDSEDIIYFYAHVTMGGEYFYMTKQGHVQGVIAEETIDHELELDEGEILLEVTPRGVVLSSHGKTYQMISPTEMEDITPISRSDQLIVEYYYLGYYDLFVSDLDRVYIRGQEMVDITSLLSASELSIDDLVQAGHQHYFIKDGDFYSIRPEGLVVEDKYGLVSEKIIYEVGDIPSFEEEAYPFYQEGWMNQDFESIDDWNLLDSLDNIYPDLTYPPRVSFIIRIEDQILQFAHFVGTNLTEEAIEYYIPDHLGFEHFIFGGDNVGETILIDESMEGKTIDIATYEKEQVLMTLYYIDENGQTIDTLVVKTYEGVYLRDLASENSNLRSLYRFLNTYIDEDMTIEIAYDARVEEAMELYVLVQRRR